MPVHSPAAPERFGQVLAGTRRGYTLGGYLEEVRLLREKLPGVAITAEMIVAFSGETDEDFRVTLRALHEIKFDQIFSFKFSARHGTAAIHLPDQIPEEVLIEGHRPGSGQPFGWTRTNKIVNLDAASGVHEGDVVKVKIVRGLKHSVGRTGDVAA